MSPRPPWEVAGMWPGRRYEKGKVWPPFLNLVASVRNFHLKSSVSLEAQLRQSLWTGFLNVTRAMRNISKVWSVISGSVTVRRSWPDRRAPEDWDGLP